MNRATRTLAIVRETLRTLSDDRLSSVRGGVDDGGERTNNTGTGNTSNSAETNGKPSVDGCPQEPLPYPGG